jgi:hypothetical protein
MRFQEIAACALSANYVGSDWFDQYPSLRFATAVVDRNEQFAAMLGQHGHFYAFDDAPLTDSETEEEDDEVPDDDDQSEVAGRYEEKGAEIHVRLSKDADGLEELVCGEETIRNESRKNVVDWLTTVYKTSRGFELGTFDSSLLAITMKTQSANWESIALGYVKDVISMAHGFISHLLKLICLDQRVREGLMSVLMDELSSKYQGAIKHVRFLLYVERMGTPATLNHYFNDNLEKRLVTVPVTCIFHLTTIIAVNNVCETISKTKRFQILSLVQSFASRILFTIITCPMYSTLYKRSMTY